MNVKNIEDRNRRAVKAQSELASILKSLGHDPKKYTNFVAKYKGQKLKSIKIQGAANEKINH
jgi:hypothetical protein